jgi:hypothetical protein
MRLEDMSFLDQVPAPRVIDPRYYPAPKGNIELRIWGQPQAPLVLLTFPGQSGIEPLQSLAEWIAPSFDLPWGSTQWVAHYPDRLAFGDRLFRAVFPDPANPMSTDYGLISEAELIEAIQDRYRFPRDVLDLLPEPSVTVREFHASACGYSRLRIWKQGAAGVVLLTFPGEPREHPWPELATAIRQRFGQFGPDTTWCEECSGALLPEERFRRVLLADPPERQGPYFHAYQGQEVREAILALYRPSARNLGGKAGR